MALVAADTWSSACSRERTESAIGRVSIGSVRRRLRYISTFITSA
jgi:hypothetical protein